MTAPNKPDEQIKLYKGPPKPIPTYRETISDRAELIIFILLAVFFVVLLLLEVI